MHQFEPIPWPIGGGIPPADFLLLTERLHNEGPPPVPGMTEHRRFPFNRQPRERCGDKQTAPCTVGYRNGECIAVHMVRLGGEWVEFQPGEKVELAVDWELRRFVVSQRYSIEKDPLARNSAFPCREMEVVSAVPFSAVVAARVSLHNIVLIFGAQPQSVMRVRTNNPWFPKGALRSTFPLAEVWFEAHCEESPAARAGWDRLLRLLPEFPPLPNGISPTTKIDQSKELVAASPVPGLLEAAAARAMTSSSRRTEHEYLRLCALARQDSAGWIPETQEEKEYWLGSRPPPPSTHAEPLLGLPWTASFGCVALAHRWKGRLPLDAMVYVWAFAYPQESLQLFEHFGNPALRCRGDRRLGLELKYLCTSTCVSLSANFFRLHESEETRYHTSFLLALEATGPDARERLTRGLARSELANSEGFMSFIARQLFRGRLWVRPSVLLLCLLRACHRWAPSIPTAPAHRAPPYPPYRDYDNDDGDGDRNTATAHADNLRPRRAATQSKKTGNAATVVELHRAAVQRLATQQPHPADWAKVADAPPPAKRQRQLVPW